MWLAFFWERNPVKTFPMWNVIGVFLDGYYLQHSDGKNKGSAGRKSGGGDAGGSCEGAAPGPRCVSHCGARKDSCARADAAVAWRQGSTASHHSVQRTFNHKVGGLVTGIVTASARFRTSFNRFQRLAYRKSLAMFHDETVGSSHLPRPSPEYPKLQDYVSQMEDMTPLHVSRRSEAATRGRDTAKPRTAPEGFQFRELQCHGYWKEASFPVTPLPSADTLSARPAIYHRTSQNFMFLPLIW